MENIKNPFLFSSSLNLIKMEETYYEADTRNIHDGVVMEAKKVTKTFHIEEQEKTSVYYITYRNNVLFKELTSIGRDVLMYIYHNIKTNEDTIDLPSKKLCNDMGISIATYYRGIRELIDIAVITKKEKQIYWINPHYVFKGDRIKFYADKCPECIKVVNTIKKDLNKPKFGTYEK